MPATELGTEAVGRIGQRGRYFVDAHERVLLLRGVNVSGSAKW